MSFFVNMTLSKKFSLKFSLVNVSKYKVISKLMDMLTFIEKKCLRGNFALFCKMMKLFLDRIHRKN